jgi:TPR repeat protein
MQAKSGAAHYKAAMKEVRKKRPDTKLVWSLLKASEKEGSVEASYAMATWLLHGHNVKVDLRAAVRLLLKASKGGVAAASYDLAVCYEKGAGVAKNPSLAVEFYLRAALGGDSQAIYEVGRCLYYGIGVRKNVAWAWIYLDRAKELGVTDGDDDKKIPSLRVIR